MINYVTTPASSSGSIRVYDEEDSYSIEAVEPAPDFASIIDTLEDQLREALESGEESNISDVCISFFNREKRRLLGELLVKLLALLVDSKDIKLDLSILVACSDLKLITSTDSALARQFGISRQCFSARKRTLLTKLDLAPPQHSKSQTACEVYRLTNKKKQSSSN